MTEEEARTAFGCGQNCTQIVLNQICGDCLSTEMIKNISTCFEGGMYCGKTCGAVVGAYMAIGLKCKNAKDLKAKFDKKFINEFKSLECKDILGYDLSKKDELKEIINQNLFSKICPKAVKFAVNFLDSQN